MATTTIFDMHFKPESVEEAQELLRGALVDTRAFDGCLGVKVIQDKDDPAHLILVEEWESVEKDGAYREWRAGDGAISDLPGLLAAAPSVSICELLSDI